MRTNVLTIRFNNEIQPFEVNLFRGAVINSLDNKLLLFHDHDGDKYRYGYPLIQYKRIKGCAAIFSLSEGAEEIGEFFSSGNFTLQLGNRTIEAKIANISPLLFNIQEWDKSFRYRISRWIPFNGDNYAKYQNIEGLADRITFLEKILTGNILSMAKGLNIWLKNQVTCKIMKISEPFLVTVKSVKMVCFNAEFETNVSLPDYIGLGKHVSIGYGIVTHPLSSERNISK